MKCYISFLKFKSFFFEIKIILIRLYDRISKFVRIVRINDRGVELERAGRVWGLPSGPVFGAIAPRIHPRICRIYKWCISQGGALPGRTEYMTDEGTAREACAVRRIVSLTNPKKRKEKKRKEKNEKQRKAASIRWRTGSRVFNSLWPYVKELFLQ